MGIQVAQLSILVEADTGPAAASLNSLNVVFQQVAQQAAAGAQQEAASQSGVIEAISAVVMSIRQQTAAIQETSAESLAAIQNLSTGARSAGGAISTMGASGAQGVALLNSAFSAAGQPLGQLSNGLFLVSQGLQIIPPQASAVEHGILGMSIALSAFGALSAAFAAPMIQQLANLKTSLADNGKDWSDYADAVQHAIDVGAGYGNNASAVEKSLAQLASVTKDETQLLQAEQVASDVAARRHISLATATDIVTRAMEGQSRGLRVLGIDMTLVANPTQALATAQTALANATTAANNAQDAYTAALQRYQDGLATAALKVNSLAAAEQNLQDAEQRVVDLQEKFAAEDLAPHIDHQTQATLALADANQHLADVQEKIAVDAEQPKIDAVGEATDRLTLATLRLKEAQDRKISQSQITPSELNALADASNKVLDAQERLADAQGSGIKTAQDQLRAAIDEQRKALDAQAQKQQDSLSQTSSLVSAQMEVKKATEELANAQQTAHLQAIGQTPQQIQQAHELRDALDKVADAQKNISIAIAQDTSDAVSKELQRTVQLRDAAEAVSKAQQGVAQAHRDAAAEAIRQADAYLSVQRAADALAAAQLKVEEASKKVAAAQDAVDNQAQRVLDAIDDKTKGTAKSMEDTWAGTLKRWMADFENFLADFGNGAGKWLTFLAPVAFGLNQLKKLFGIGDGVAGAAEAAGAAIGDEGFAGAMAGAADGAGVLVGMLGGLVLGGFLLVDEAIHKITGFDFLDWSRKLDEKLVFGLFHIGEDIVMGIWHGIESQWDNFMSFVDGLFGGFISKITRSLGIFSPSRVFHDIGANLMEGLHQGIDDNSGKPLQTLMDLSNQFAQQQFKLMTTGNGNLGGGVAGFLGQTGSQVTIKRDVILQVQGNVTTERDLVNTLRDELTKSGQGQGGNLFGGYA